MKLLTKNSDYAIRALAALAMNKDDFLSSKEIAKRQAIPHPFLRRILQDLMGRDLVVSREGGGGGFKINADPKRINIVDVIRIFQGNLQFSECLFRKKLCLKRSTCVLRKEIKRVEKIVEKEFKRITISRLLKK